jgi:hypothetical protein
MNTATKPAVVEMTDRELFEEAENRIGKLKFTTEQGINVEMYCHIFSGRNKFLSQYGITLVYNESDPYWITSGKQINILFINVEATTLDELYEHYVNKITEPNEQILNINKLSVDSFRNLWRIIAIRLKNTPPEMVAMG